MRHLTIVLVFVTLRSTAIAAPRAPNAEDLYAEGQAAYERADYAVAIERWQAAYQLSGESGLLFNVAQAQRLSDDCRAAIATYRRFAEIDPTSEQRQLALDLVQELEPTCPAPSPALPVPIKQSPLVTALNLAAPLSHPKSGRPGRGLRIAGLATGGAGVITLGIGLTIGYRAARRGDEITAACADGCNWIALEDDDAAARRNVKIGRALDVAGAVAIASGAIMYYLGRRGDAVTVVPRARDGAVVSWSGSW